MSNLTFTPKILTGWFQVHFHASKVHVLTCFVIVFQCECFICFILQSSAYPRSLPFSMVVPRLYKLVIDMIDNHHSFTKGVDFRCESAREAVSRTDSERFMSSSWPLFILLCV